MHTIATAWASLGLALFFSRGLIAQQPAQPIRLAEPAKAAVNAAPAQEPAADEAASAASAQQPQGPSPLLTKIQAQQYRRTVQTVFDARIRYELGEDPGDAIESAETASSSAPSGVDVAFPDDMPDEVRAQILEQLAAQGTPPDGVVIAEGGEASEQPAEDGDPAASGDDSAQREVEAARNAARFELWVLAGAWPEVGAFLAETAGDDAAAIFAHLLQQLSQQDQVILPAEGLQLAALSPEPMTETQVEQLITLLQKAKTRGSLDGVPSLMAGHPQFLLEEETARARGAQLLAGLGLTDALQPYLPEMRDPETRPGVLAQHARYHQYLAMQASDFGTRMTELNRAFDLLRSALNSDEADASDREEVLTVVLSLLPELPETEVAVWRETLFAEGNGFGLSALSGVVKSMEQFERQRTIRTEREPIVREAKALGEVLAGLGEGREQPSAALGLVGMRLAAEAEFSLEADPNDYRYYNYLPNVGRVETYIESSELLASMPSVAWMEQVDAGLAERLMRLRVRLAAQARLPEDALATVQLAGARRPAFAQELAELFLQEWTSALEAQRVAGLNQNQSIFYVNGVRQVNPGSAPLTRAHQMRSLAKLAEVLQAFGELGLEPMAPEALVEGFAACHSSAEVYQVEDIEKLLGPIDEMPARMATALADNMRRNLSSRWASDQVQAAAGTKRNKVQMEAEIERGYVLAEQVLARAIEQEPDGWMNVLIRGALMFDFAEFSHKRDPDLREYAPIRDSAFVSLGRAAELYAAEVERGSVEPTVLPFALWFSAALGASELGYLTANTKPDNDQVDLLREALQAMSPADAKGHLDLFATWVEAVNVPAIMKPRFLRHALRVLEDHDHGAAEAARARLQLYEELVQEVLLVAEVDGDPEVASDQPFGVRLSLRYTAALEREAGGFAKYLQNQVYAPATGVQVDYRDRFEEQVREALYESFEVDSIHFHRPEVEDRPVGVHGWMEKPLAYLVLRARDAAVDRISSMHLDMDFSDGKGTVLLPVQSAIVLLDARGEARARPYEKLEVEQVLDAREWADGKLQLEVRTRGRGVLPELATLLPGLESVEGFVVGEVEDHPLNITEVDAESSPVMPLTERSWTVHLAPAEGDAARASFTFPAVALEADLTEIKRYDDLDLVDAEATVALDASALGGAGMPWWAWIIVLGGAGAVFFAIARNQGSAEAEVIVLPLPQRLTALSALAYLRRVGEEPRVRSQAAWQDELAETVASLEQRSFAAGGEQPDEAELHSLLQRWRDRAVA